MDKLKYLLFIVPFLVFTNVSASDLNPRSYLNNFQSNGYFDYTATSDDEQRPQESFTYVGRTSSNYSSKLYGIRAFFNVSLVANHNYKIRINTTVNNFNSTGFNYTNAYVCFGSSYASATSDCIGPLGVSGISTDYVSFNFRPTSNYNYFQFSLGPQRDRSYPLTSSYTFNISSFTIDDLSAPPTNPTNNDVISNDNQNTTDIITNDNRNKTEIIGEIIQDTQNQINNSNEQFYNTNQNINNAKDNIINNQNENFNKIKTDLNICKEQNINFTLYRTGYLGDNGEYRSNSDFFISNYIELVPDLPYKFDIYDTNNDSIRYGDYCLYDENKVLLSCRRLDSGVNSTIYLFSNSNAYYMRTTLYKSNAVLNNAYISGVICSSKLDETNDTLHSIDDTTKDINGYLQDDSQANMNSFWNDIKDIGIDESPISSFITLPITLINDFIDGLDDNTCKSFNLGNLLGTDLILPCINPQNFLGQNLWTIIDALTSVFMIYNIVMLFVKVFNDLTSLKDSYDTIYTPDDFYEARLAGKRGY